MKIKKIVSITFTVIVVVIVTVLGVLFAYFANQYNQSYVSIDFVEKTDTYVLPEYPDIEYETEETDDLLNNYVASETESFSAESIETVTVETIGVETIGIETETGFESTDVLPETEKADTPKAETKAVQENKVKKDVNVYGGVPIERVVQKNKDIINVLLIGQDSRFDSGSRGRSDTMLVVSYNKKTGEVKLISLLRDSLVPIKGYGWNRLNTTYAFGGIGLTINTLNRLFDLDLQYFVVVDITVTEDLINHIGGIDLYITKSEAEYNNAAYFERLKEGVCHLNGILARIYMQNRSDSDFGRTGRQRAVIKAVIDKVMTQMTLAEILDLVEYGSGVVKTNIDLLTMISLATSLVSQKEILTVESQTVPFTDSFKYAYYNRMAIISFDIDAASKRINQFLYN